MLDVQSVRPPHATATMRIPVFTYCRAGRTIAFDGIHSWSFRKAIMLPEIEIEPMIAPAIERPLTTWSPSEVRSSTAATAAAAPPPIPLNIATIWGIAVILTTRAQYHPPRPPIATPAKIQRKFESPGLRNVTATAMSIASPAYMIPRRAVVGPLIALRPRMKTRTATT